MTATRKPKRFPLTAAVTAQALADYLAENGIPIVSVSEGDDVEDGEIRIGSGIDVQVGIGYACVTWTDGEGDDIAVHYRKMRASGRLILADLREIMASLN